MFSEAGPARACPQTSSRAISTRPFSAAHGDSPRAVLAASTVEDCFYVALEAARIAREYSTPVIILSDSSLATRIEAFDEPDLAKLMRDPKPDLSPRPSNFRPYALDRHTQHAPPGTRMLDGKYPVVTGLEHDEMGHPTGSSKLHAAMTAKRRSKLQMLAQEIPGPQGPWRSRRRSSAGRVGLDLWPDSRGRQPGPGTRRKPLRTPSPPPSPSAQRVERNL